MKLTVIGCSGSVPGPDSAASSYLVTADGFNLILDLGSGALGSLQRHIAVPEIGAIGLSHLHPDHCMDLCGLYVAARYAPGAPIPRIPVFGPPGTSERMALAYDLPLEPGMEEELEFHAWQDVQQIGPFTIRTAPMAHPVPAYAIRVEHGNKSLVYTGDTGPNDALIELARGADMLLSEAALPDNEPNNPVDLHMTPLQIRKMRLIRPSPRDRDWLRERFASVSRNFGCNVTIASDDSVLAVQRFVPFRSTR